MQCEWSHKYELDTEKKDSNSAISAFNSAISAFS